MTNRFRQISLVAYLLSALVTFPSKTYADTPQKKSLLLIGDSTKWVTMGYDYTGHTSNLENSGTRKDKGNLLYHYGVPISISDPHLLRLDTQMELKGEMESDKADGSKSELGGKYAYQYNVNATALDEKKWPVTMHMSSNTDTIMSPMAPTYDSKVNTMGAAISYSFAGTEKDPGYCKNGHVVHGNKALAELYATYAALLRAIWAKQHPTPENVTLIPRTSDEINPFGNYSPDNNLMDIILPPPEQDSAGWDVLSAAICGLSARLSWEQASQETTGGTVFKGKTNTYQLEIAHLYQNSTSSFDATISTANNATTNNATTVSTGATTSNTETTSNKQTMINFKNTLKSDTQTANLSNMSLMVQDTMTAGIPNLNVMLDEVLTKEIVGDRLGVEVDYDFSHNATLGVSGGEQTVDSHAIAAELQANAGDYTSRLRGRYSVTDFPNGSENHMGIMANVGYKKNLPLIGAQLTGSITGEHDLGDRQTVPTDIVFREEEHKMAHQQDIFILNNFQPIKAVTAIISKAPDITYTEGIDYTVDLATGRVTIQPGGKIDPAGDGMNIYISYSVTINSSSKFTTDTVTFFDSLSFARGKYILSGTYTMQNQSLVSGNANGLYDTRLASLKAQANLGDSVLSVEYHNNDVNKQKFSYIESELTSRLNFPLTTLTLDFKDRYTMNGSNDAIPAYNENTASVAAAVSRNLTEKIQGTLAVNAVDDRRDGAVNDFLFGKVMVMARFNKLTINVTAQSTMRIKNIATPKTNTTSRDDYFHITFTRVF